MSAFSRVLLFFAPFTRLIELYLVHYIEMVKNALVMAIGRRNPEPGLIHHSDRGTQYACNEYRRLLQSHGMISSMSRSGNCLDNTVAERFFRTLKSECLANWRNMAAEEVKHDIVNYIEMFYNSERLHSSSVENRVL